MIVVTWGVSITEMSSCIVMTNMKTFIKKKTDIILENKKYYWYIN